MRDNSGVDRGARVRTCRRRAASAMERWRDRLGGIGGENVLVERTVSNTNFGKGTVAAVLRERMMFEDEEVT